MALASDLGGSLYFKGAYSSVSNQGPLSVEPPIISTLGANKSSASQDFLLLANTLLKVVEYDSVYGISMGGGSVLYYRLRGRDSACPGPTPSYVYWTVTDVTTPYGGLLPCGGPVVDLVVLETFAQ